MSSTDTSFEFHSYTLDAKTQTAHFTYVLSQKNSAPMRFVETLEFPLSFSLQDIPAQLVDSALYNLHLILGINYWKIFCPPHILISTQPLSLPQAEFWNTVYTKGLGEFFYTNAIDFRNLVQFPYTDTLPIKPLEVARKNRSLVGIGGGKDSILSIELLKKAKKNITGFILETQRPYAHIPQLISALNIPAVTVRRTLDPKLLEYTDDSNAYKGHIPISAVFAFAGVLTAVLYHFSSFIVSNERSASSGNLEYLGTEINHQWSKSEEFETMFQQYAQTYITPSISYFSLLRPLSEYHIVKLFSQYTQYLPLFTSCNRTFSITQGIQTQWCKTCAKCACMFGMLSAFLEPAQLIKIFKGNVLNNSSLIPLYKQLTGIQGTKPFDCVTEFDELKLALFYAEKKPEFAQTPVMTMVRKDILPTIVHHSKLEKTLLLPEKKKTLPIEYSRLIEHI